MNYIISDNELNIWIENMKLAGFLVGEPKLFVSDFLKDKIPVEEITDASISPSGDLTAIMYNSDRFENKIGNYEGKKVKIYFKEIK